MANGFDESNGYILGSMVKGFLVGCFKGKDRDAVFVRDGNPGVKWVLNEWNFLYAGNKGVSDQGLMPGTGELVAGGGLAKDEEGRTHAFDEGKGSPVPVLVFATKKFMEGRIESGGLGHGSLPLDRMSFGMRWQCMAQVLSVVFITLRLV